MIEEQENTLDSIAGGTTKPLFAIELQEFKKRNNIKSADEWAKTSEVSKSTIVRGLNGDGKDIGVITLLKMIAPYGETLDQLLHQGVYDPEYVERESLRNDIREKIETVIDVIDNTDEIPQEPAEEIKAALEEAHEYITNDTPEKGRCDTCTVLREMVADLKEEKSIKDKWLNRLFKLSATLMTLLLLSLICISTLLIN